MAGDGVVQIIQAELGATKDGRASKLARAVGVSAETVSKWRRGKSSPGPDKYPAIEEFFGLPQGTLRSAAGMAPTDEVPLLDRMDRFEREQAAQAELIAEIQGLVARIAAQPPSKRGGR